MFEGSSIIDLDSLAAQGALDHDINRIVSSRTPSLLITSDQQITTLKLFLPLWKNSLLSQIVKQS